LAAIQVYLLGVLGVVISTFRAETPKLISDAPPLIAAALAIGLVVWAHPQRALLVSDDDRRARPRTQCTNAPRS
jgi:hypothetical protein